MKILSRIAATFAIAAFAACSGNIDSEQGGDVVTGDFEAPFTLSANMDVVEADGKTSVEFSLKDKYGREMLDEKRTLQSINITSDDINVRVPRMEKSVSFIKNGDYVFKATYLGVESANTVTIKAQNRSAYEVYHRNVALFKSTSVWCPACPLLANRIHELSDDTKDHIVVLGCHGDYNAADPFSLYVGTYSLGQYMINHFGGSGWPTLVYDLCVVNKTNPSKDAMESGIYERRLNSPATCGIKVSSVTVEGTALKVNTTLATSTGGDYDLACAVLCDGLKFDDQMASSANNDGIYNEVVLSLSPNFLQYSSESGKSLAKDHEMEKEFTFEFGGNVPSASDLQKYYVAVWAHKKVDGGSSVDNIVTCGYGKTADYRYNE